jgi:GT2 family glycosyltransferase
VNAQAAAPPVAIVVLNYNGLEDTVRCLESLRAIPGGAHRVILVDNASAVDPCAAAAAAYPDLECIRNDRNLGYAGGNNRGIERALALGATFVVVLNNDTTVAPRLVQALLDAFSTDPSLGIVGPVINFMDEPDRVMTDGVAFNRGPGTAFFPRIVVPVVPGNPPVRVDIVNGCCLMARADVFRAVGLFDEALFIVHEESDFCLRAGAAGFGCAVLGETLVWHKGSSAFDRSGRQVQRYFDARNLYYLLRRHAGRVPGSRPFGVSRRFWWLDAFYRWSTELEAGKPTAARAVLEGVHDALVGWTGPRPPRVRPAVGLLHGAFVLVRGLARVTRGRH